MDKKNILVVSPHPDDMEIGMGGTVSKLIAQGFNVVSLIVTDGRRSTSISGLSEDDISKIRETEAHKAAHVLGVKDLILLGLPHVKDTVKKAWMKTRLKQLIDHFSPAEIYTTHPTGDKHPTHQTVSRITIEAARDCTQSAPERIWCYEVWTPFEMYDRIEDISDYIDKKAAAVNAHKSQIEYKDYAEGILGLNRYRAVFDHTSRITKSMYAEVFIALSLKQY